MDSPFSKLTTRVSLAMVVVVVLSMTAMVRHWGFVVMPTLKAEEKTKVELLVVPYARLLEAAVSEENQQNLDDVLDQVISLKGSGHEFPIVVRLKVSLLDGRVFERKNDVDDVAKPFRAEVPIFSPVTRTLLGSVVLEYNDVFYRHLIAKVWEEVAWTLAIILLLLIAMQFWVRSLLSPLTDLSGRLEHVDLDAEITLPLASRSMSAEVRQVWGAIEQLFARLRQRDEAVASGHIAAQEALQSKLEAETENKEKSQFLANMSHELRTPLNAIIGYSEMLYDEAGESGNANMAGDLVRIVSSGRHLLSLINGVLDLAKIDAGRTQLFLSDYSLTEIVKEVVDAVSPLISANGNQLTIQCDDNVGNVYADISKLKQALINVLGNAAKFTHDGNVLLAVEREFSAGQERVLFRIVDTGIGISEEQQHALFKPFTQVDESTTREYGGTGLGLTISRSVCRLMGGEIKVRSEEGKGSEFVLQIPIKVLEPYGVGDATAAYEVNAPQEDPEKKRLLDKRPNQNSRERREKVSTILVIDMTLRQAIFWSAL